MTEDLFLEEDGFFLFKRDGQQVKIGGLDWSEWVYVCTYVH